MSTMADKPAGSAADTKIIVIANPTTGAMEKITLSQLKTYCTTGDTTPPTIVSVTAISATVLRFVYSENVTMTLTGHSFKKNGAAWTASSVSGSGTTWDVAMGTPAISTDVLLRTYDSATGNTLDASSNELVSYTDQSITNSIASSAENIVWTSLVQTTNAGSGTITGNNTTTPAGGTATKKLAKANGNYVQFVIGSTVSDSDAVVLCLDDTNDSVYTWAGGGTRVISLASAYYASGVFYTGQDSATSTSLSGTPTVGDAVRIEIANTNDLLIKVNGTTLYTWTGALTGIVDIYVKAPFAVNSTAKKLTTCTGLGLV